MTLPILKPSQAKGSSVARVERAWYVACASADLGTKPKSITLLGMPLVVFRTENQRPAALLDRCPHRNVPLSAGQVVGGRIQCCYHGWTFDSDGHCKSVPTLVGEPDVPARQAPSFPCREEDGFVWIWGHAESEPDCDPYRFEMLGAPGYTTVREELTFPGSLHAAAEVTLDVPHTAFVHAGLFRTTGRKTNRVEVIVRRSADRVEAQYVGEPRPSGVVGRLLAPQGGVVEHFDRFIHPSILQVEYRLGDSHVLVTGALVPETDFRTRIHAVVCFKLPVPGWPLVPVVKPLALSIFQQDVKVLNLQTANLARFGGESFVSTEVDVLGPHISRLLRQAERGTPKTGTEVSEKRFFMDI